MSANLQRYLHDLTARAIVGTPNERRVAREILATMLGTHMARGTLVRMSRGPSLNRANLTAARTLANMKRR